MESLSRAQARRVALVSQGFRDPRHATATMRTFDRTLARTGVLQVDSVNVLQRAHYMPLFSRMGPYDVRLLRRASQQRPRRLVEYWAHVQALMPVELWPVMRHRMEHYRVEPRWHGERDSALSARLLKEVRDGGPATARDLDDGAPRTRDHWGWNWSQTKRALDYLYLTGDLAVAARNTAFEAVYDVPERVIPPDVLARPALSVAEAGRELIRRASRSHGVGTEQCLRDYYRMPVAQAKAAIASLVDDGELVPAAIEGWHRPAYLHHEIAARGLPRKVDARALLSPFDPVVWERERTERLFGFRYRIEIYVPEAKREHGYYVLPFLLGDRIVGRVDLKADRKQGLLVVQAAYAEDHAPPETAFELAEELRDMARWLGLEQVVVAPRGDLSVPLEAELAM